MALPLPRVVADVGPGGSITTAMRGQNALTKSALENMFYAPNIKSEIDYRNAMKNRANTLTPLEAAKMQLDNDYYVSKAKSLMDLQNAQTNKINYVLTHPGYMGGEDTKTIQSLIDLGLIPGNSIKPASIQNNNPPIGIPQSVTTQNTDMLQGNSRLVPAPATNNLNFTIPPQNQNPVDMNPQQNNPVANMGFSGNPAAPFNTGNPLVDNILNRRYAQPAYQNQMTKAFNWVHLPVEQKNQLIAQGLGMGIDPIQMQRYVNDGLSLPQIAQKEGLDPENLPPPIYPPTTATKTRTQQVAQVSHELDYISSAVTPVIKRYADTFLGISPEKWKDMISSDPAAQDRYGEYIGALSLQSGLATGRALMEGTTRPGIEIMKAIRDSSLKGIDTHSPVKMTGRSFEKAQNFINEKLRKGARIRITTGMNPFSEISRQKVNKKNENNSSAPTGMTRMVDQKGIEHFVPDKNVEKASKKPYFFKKVNQ